MLANVLGVECVALNWYFQCGNCPTGLSGDGVTCHPTKSVQENIENSISSKCENGDKTCENKSENKSTIHTVVTNLENTISSVWDELGVNKINLSLNPCEPNPCYPTVKCYANFGDFPVCGECPHDMKVCTYTIIFSCVWRVPAWYEGMYTIIFSCMLGVPSWYEGVYTIIFFCVCGGCPHGMKVCTLLYSPVWGVPAWYEGMYTILFFCVWRVPAWYEGMYTIIFFCVLRLSACYEGMYTIIFSCVLGVPAWYEGMYTI